MTWYEDLTPHGGDYALKAVGWLSRGHPFPLGEVSEAFFHELCELLVNPWNHVYAAGVHHCELCRFSGGNGMVTYQGFQISGVCSASLFVPGQGFIYEAPASIAHYIDAHGYQPPTEFCEAVMQCPPMRSVAYFKALLDNGGRELVKRGKMV